MIIRYFYVYGIYTHFIHKIKSNKFLRFSRRLHDIFMGKAGVLVSWVFLCWGRERGSSHRFENFLYEFTGNKSEFSRRFIILPIAHNLVQCKGSGGDCRVNTEIASRTKYFVHLHVYISISQLRDEILDSILHFFHTILVHKAIRA